MRISYSALDTYRTCPLKYKYQQIDRIKTPKSKEAVFGTIVHSTLKFIHNPGIISPSAEQALEYFSKNWNSEVFENETEERSAFSQGVEMIREYYRKNDISRANIVDLESRFQYEICSEKTPSDPDPARHIVSGIIDRIDKTDDGYEIIDYKTAKKMPSQEKVDHDLQLSVYLKAFLSRYPKETANLDKITVSLYFLKHGVKLSAKRTAEQLKDSEKLFLETISRIENGEFKPVVSPLCDWCGYQRQCPMWKHKFKDERKIDTNEINSAIEEYIDLKDAMGATKKRFAELQEMILRYMEQEGVERTFGENGLVSKISRKTYAYDATKIRGILEPLGYWDDVVKIDGISLKKIMDALPDGTRKSLESAKKVTRESTALSVKKG